MNYEDFDKKYNKRDKHGVIISTSVITLDGTIIFSGTIEEIENFWDENTKLEPKWNNGKFIGMFYNDKEVVTTNIGKDDTYGKYIMSKLQF